MSNMKRDAFIIALNVYVARPENGIVPAQRELFDEFAARIVSIYPAPSKRAESMTINVAPGSWFSSR